MDESSPRESIEHAPLTGPEPHERNAARVKAVIVPRWVWPSEWLWVWRALLATEPVSRKEKEKRRAAGWARSCSLWCEHRRATSFLRHRDGRLRLPRCISWPRPSDCHRARERRHKPRRADRAIAP